ADRRECGSEAVARRGVRAPQRVQKRARRRIEEIGGAGTTVGRRADENVRAERRHCGAEVAARGRGGAGEAAEEGARRAVEEIGGAGRGSARRLEGGADEDVAADRGDREAELVARGSAGAREGTQERS